MIDTKLRKKFDKLFDIAGGLFVKKNLTPREITLIAFMVGLVSAFCILLKWNLLAVLFLWASGFLDVMDGTVAKLTKKVSQSGMFMDLTFDRMVEAVIILALAVAYPTHYIGFLLFVISALFNFTTFMIAGIIYKNTSMKGMHYDIGIIERTEAFIAFTLMILFPQYLSLVLFVINSLIFATGFIRFYRINVELGKEGN